MDNRLPQSLLPLDAPQMLGEKPRLQKVSLQATVRRDELA
jgi:hypothetical protein